MKDRTQKQVNGFLKTKFTFKGFNFKPLSARSLLLIDQAGSTFGDGKLQGLFELLYISGTESVEVLEAIDSGNFKNAVLDFADNFTPEDLEELTGLLNSQQDEINANIVEVKSGSDSKK